VIIWAIVILHLFGAGIFFVFLFGYGVAEAGDRISKVPGIIAVTTSTPQKKKRGYMLSALVQFLSSVYYFILL
jgi:hypothetical protein